MTDPVIRAWQMLTGALLAGALAAGDFDAAAQSMHETVDRFPLREVTGTAASPDELARVAGVYAREASKILDSAIAAAQVG